MLLHVLCKNLPGLLWDPCTGFLLCRMYPKVDAECRREGGGIRHLVKNPQNGGKDSNRFSLSAQRVGGSKLMYSPHHMQEVDLDQCEMVEN